jgi:hypothetical protein
MKVVAVALLVSGLLCNSILAMAEDPVPFRTLMAAAGKPPSISELNAGQDNSAAQPTRPARATHMTSGGKAMTGFGIGLVACGGFVIIGTALFNSWENSSRKAALYGGAIGLAGTGTVLIVLGSHRRTAQ